MDKAKRAVDEGNLKSALEHLYEAKRFHNSWKQADDLIKTVQDKLTAQDLAQSGDEELASGNFSGALSLWNKSLQYDESSVVHMKIGAEYADNGKTSDALLHFMAASKLGHPQAEKALRLCQSYHNFNPATGPA